MSVPPRQVRRGPWTWDGGSTGEQPQRPLWKPDTAYPTRHTTGDHHPGQRGMSRRRNRRRDQGRSR